LQVSRGSACDDENESGYTTRRKRKVNLMCYISASRKCKTQGAAENHSLDSNRYLAIRRLKVTRAEKPKRDVRMLFRFKFRDGLISPLCGGVIAFCWPFFPIWQRPRNPALPACDAREADPAPAKAFRECAAAVVLETPRSEAHGLLRETSGCGNSTACSP
jgi:hypothetical protein